MVKLALPVSFPLHPSLSHSWTFVDCSRKGICIKKQALFPGSTCYVWRNRAIHPSCSSSICERKKAVLDMVIRETREDDSGFETSGDDIDMVRVMWKTIKWLAVDCLWTALVVSTVMNLTVVTATPAMTTELDPISQTVQVARSVPSVDSILARQLARRFRDMSDDELTEVLEQLVVASRTTCTQNQLSEETSSLAEARKVVIQSEQVKDSPSSSSSSINAGSENYETLSKRKDPGNDISEVIISKSKNMQVDKVKGSTTRAESESNILTKTDQSQDGKEEMGSSNIQLSKRLESVESGMVQTFGIQASHVLLLEKTQKAFKEVITAIEQCLQLILYVVGPICLSTVTVLSLVGWKTLSYKSGGSSTASQSAEGPIFTETTNVSAASKSQLFNSSFQIHGHLLQSSFDSLRLFIRKFLQSARKFEIWSILEGSARSLCSFLSTMLFTVNKLVSIFLNQQSESQAFKEEAYDSFSNRISNEDIYLNDHITASIESSLQTFENAEPAPEIGSLPVNKSKGSSGTHGKFMPSIGYANNSQLQVAFGSQDQELQDLRDFSHELPSTIKGKLDHSYGSGSASTQAASAFVKAIKDPTPYQREKTGADFANYPEWAHSHRGRTFEERDSNATERLSKASNGESDDAKILKRPLQSRSIWDDSSLLRAIKGMKLQIGDEWNTAERNVLDSFTLETQAKRRVIDNINERQNVVHMHKQNVHAMDADSMQHHPPKPNVSHGLNSKENTSSHPFLRILLANDLFSHKGKIWVRDSDGVFVQQKAEIVKKQKSG